MLTKKLLILWMFFFCTSNSFAISEKEEKQNKAAFKSIQESINYADSKLPPCEGLDRIFDELTKYSAPKSCPKSYQLYSLVEKRVRHLRDNCREMSRWMEDTLRSPSLCYMAEDYERMNKIKNQLMTFKKQVSSERQEEAEDKILSDSEFKYFERMDKKPEGELIRNECMLPVQVSLQVRKITLSFANKHYGIATHSLDIACEPAENGKENYFNYLRGGEEALD